MLKKKKNLRYQRNLRMNSEERHTLFIWNITTSISFNSPFLSDKHPEKTAPCISNIACLSVFTVSDRKFHAIIFYFFSKNRLQLIRKFRHLDNQTVILPFLLKFLHRTIPQRLSPTKDNPTTRFYPPPAQRIKPNTFLITIHTTILYPCKHCQ